MTMTKSNLSEPLEMDTDARISRHKPTFELEVKKESSLQAGHAVIVSKAFLVTSSNLTAAGQGHRQHCEGWIPGLKWCSNS